MSSNTSASTKSYNTIDVEDTKTAEQAALEDEICFIGYVMDSFCIDRGSLLDGYNTQSPLLEPQRHSIHCLVDLPRCVHSGYQMLLDPPTTVSTTSGGVLGGSDMTYCRALQLDDHGNQLLLDLMRSMGDPNSCTSCTGSPSGAMTNGFRATVYGKIVQGESSKPPFLIQVSRVQSDRDGCQGTQPYIPPLESLNCHSGSYLPYIAAHGSLMLLSWGFLLPFGIVSARMLRHFPNSTLWFQVHRIVQPIGIVLALAGWSVALAGPFDVLGSGVYDAPFVHAVLGTIVMGLALLQPIHAYYMVRPNKQQQQQQVVEQETTDNNTTTNDNNNNNNSTTEYETTTYISTIINSKQRHHRRWWSLHKILGYLVTFLAMVNCFIGMALSGKYQEIYFHVLLVAWASVSLYGIMLGLHRRWSFGRDDETSHERNNNNHDHNVVMDQGADTPPDEFKEEG
jgi:hypothetical protein